MSVRTEVPCNSIGNFRVGDWEFRDFVSMDDLEFLLDQIIAEERSWPTFSNQI
jgi:hypothetical protein